MTSFELAKRRKVYVEQLDAALFALLLALLGLAAIVAGGAYAAGKATHGLLLFCALLGCGPLLWTLSTYQFLHRRPDRRRLPLVVIVLAPLLFAPPGVADVAALAAGGALVCAGLFTASLIRLLAERAATAEIEKLPRPLSVRFVHLFDRFGDGVGFEMFVASVSGADSDEDDED